MREINGYTFIPDFGHSIQMFGPGDKRPITLSANKVKLYAELRQCKNEADAYVKTQKNIKSISLANLALDIASLQELDSLKSGSLIVLAYLDPNFVKFLGPYDGKHSFCNNIASEITQNNFTPFTTSNGRKAIDLAKHVAAEFIRQAQGTAEIANFKMNSMGVIYKAK